jgi:hypothetical protein
MSDRPDEVVATAGADYSPILQPGESLDPLKDFELFGINVDRIGANNSRRGL